MPGGNFHFLALTHHHVDGGQELGLFRLRQRLRRDRLALIGFVLALYWL